MDKQNVVYPYSGMLFGNKKEWSFFFNKFIYFWLHWVFFAARGLSQIAASGGLLFFAVGGLPIAMASLAAEHGF